LVGQSDRVPIGITLLRLPICRQSFRRNLRRSRPVSRVIFCDPMERDSPESLCAFGLFDAEIFELPREFGICNKIEIGSFCNIGRVVRIVRDLRIERAGRHCRFGVRHRLFSRVVTATSEPIQQSHFVPPLRGLVRSYRQHFATVEIRSSKNRQERIFSFTLATRKDAAA